MSVEWYAPVVILVGLCLWLWGSVLDSVVAMLFFSLFGGGAALILGHSTVQPVALMLVFVLAHLLLSMFRRSAHANLGLKVNGFLAFYCIYGAVTAFILPKIFFRAMVVPPMVMNGQHDFYILNPLRYTTQNLTTAVYLIGTLITSIAAAAAAMNPNSRRVVVQWSIIIAWVHIFFGVAGEVLTKFGGEEIIKIFRNATYAELVQTTEGGFLRMSGVMPEPSTYATFAFGCFVLMVELWLRNVSPRVTMATAAALALMIIACTSSTGYASLALYSVVVVFRVFTRPKKVPLAKVIRVGFIGLTLATLALTIFAFNSHLAVAVGRVLNDLTLDKVDSSSGQQRLFWAREGLKAVRITWGLGIGAGSFRSSSLLIAVIASTGVIGFLALAAHILLIFKPLRRDTYLLPGHPSDAVATAASWAAVGGLLPAMISSPTPDPSFAFAIMGGLALGWRYVPTRRRIAAAGGDRPRHAFGKAPAFAARTSTPV